MPDTGRLLVDRLNTPLGELVIVADEAGRLRVMEWESDEARLRRVLARNYGEGDRPLEPASNPAGITTAMTAYFDGELEAIDRLSVSAGGTPFQRAVWTALRDIPCGTTTAYGELARRIGRPAAVRAVGLANGANPIAVVVPCHRVIGANGTLTGYGGGLHRKRWLLEHEGAACARSLLVTRA